MMLKSLISRIKKFFKSKDDKKPLPPKDFFAQIKDRRQVVTQTMLLLLKESLNGEIQAFLANGQVDSAEKLLFHLNCVEREQAVIAAGLTTYVYRDDLDMFITRVSQSVVKIIDLAHYERKIPKEQSDKIQAVKDLFDEVYIIFTDYTGREERKIEKKEQARDPIAFGAFKTKDNKIWNHRFYFICDWSDEYCDLTLDKYVAEMMAADHLEPAHIAPNITIAELEERIKLARHPEDQKSNDRFVTLVSLQDNASRLNNE